MNRSLIIGLSVLLSVVAVECSNYMFAPDTLGSVVKERFARRSAVESLQAAYDAGGVDGLTKACEQPIARNDFVYTCFVGHGLSFTSEEDTEYETAYLRLHASKFEAEISAQRTKMSDSMYYGTPSGHIAMTAFYTGRSVGEHKIGIRLYRYKNLPSLRIHWRS